MAATTSQRPDQVCWMGVLRRTLRLSQRRKIAKGTTRKPWEKSGLVYQSTISLPTTL